MPRILTPEELDALKQDVLKSISPDTSEEEFNRVYPAKMAQAMATAQSQPPDQTVGHFLGGVWRNANPASLVTGPYHLAKDIPGAARSLLDTVSQGYEKMKEAPTVHEKVWHGIGMVPFVGPPLIAAHEAIQGGDVAGGLGQAAGLAATFGLPAAMNVGRAVPGSRASRVLETRANDIVSQKVLGPGNIAYRGDAEWLAPQIVKLRREGVIPKGAGREDIRVLAEEKLGEVGHQLDLVQRAEPALQQPIPISEPLAYLKQAMHGLVDSSGKPTSPQAGKRLELLRARMQQIIDLGGRDGEASFADLRKIRDENYRIAREATAYEHIPQSPLADEGWAAAQTGDAIRGAFADRSPASVPLNKQYNLWSTLSDTLNPALGRPRQTALSEGMTGGARVAGAVAGQALNNPKLAAIMALLGPLVRQNRMQPSYQLRRAVRLSERAQGERLPPGLEWLGRVGLATGIGGALTPPDENKP